LQRAADPETAQALQDEFSASVVCAFGMTEATLLTGPR